MAQMPRPLLATLFFLPVALGAVPSGQPVSTLHIKVVLTDAEKKTIPVPHHALLVSENPGSAPPRRVVTALDGTADVPLRPGNYTVESDQPMVMQGHSYEWRETIDVAAGRATLLELTADNAQVAPVDSTSNNSAGDASVLLMRWQDSIVALWTPTTHASGFVIDARGLIATNQQVVGTATSVEVQLTPSIKVAGTVLAADAARAVAILWIDPKALPSTRPPSLECAPAPKPTLANGQEISTIGISLRGQKAITSGTVVRVEPHGVMSDLIVARGSTGGPVFAADGRLVGISSPVDEEERKDDGRSGGFRVARLEDICDVVESAEKRMTAVAAPAGAHLPLEPARPFPVDALEDAAKRRVGSLTPYQASSSDFDIAFITPVMTYGAQYQIEQSRQRERGNTRAPGADPAFVRPLMDFSNWSEYVADFPPVLLVRVTPRLVESVWTTIARGAARTQGLALPPIKRFKSGFLRMRAFCGDVEVTPIHPFKLEQRVSETDAVYEGLYVFDPGALAPACGTVKLVLYSEKEPEKADTRPIDPKVIGQIWEDFAPYRAVTAPPSRRQDAARTTSRHLWFALPLATPRHRVLSAGCRCDIPRSDWRERSAARSSAARFPDTSGGSQPRRAGI